MIIIIIFFIFVGIVVVIVVIVVAVHFGAGLWGVLSVPLLQMETGIVFTWDKPAAMVSPATLDPMMLQQESLSME